MVYSYGHPADPPVTGESLPSGMDGRSPVVWGQSLFGGITASVTFTYSALPGILQPSSVVLLRRSITGGSWEAVPATGLTHNTTTRSFTITGVSDSYEYSIGVNLSLNPLPVQLTSLYAYRKDGELRFTWQTATEINSHAFEVQLLDEDLNRWTVLATLPAAGSSNSPRTYNWTLAGASNERTRWRLNMIDRDGSSAFSQVLSIPAGTDLLPSFHIYPNPAAFDLAVEIQSEGEDLVSINIYDMLGRMQYAHAPATIKRGTQTFAIPVSSLHPGIYLIEVQGAQRRLSKLLRIAP